MLLTKISDEKSNMYYITKTTMCGVYVLCKTTMEEEEKRRKLSSSPSPTVLSTKRKVGEQTQRSQRGLQTSN